MVLSLIQMLPPAWIMIIGACVLSLVRSQMMLRSLLVLVLPILTLADIYYVVSHQLNITMKIAGADLSLVQVHPFTSIFAVVFCLAAWAGGLFALLHSKTKELVAAYIYAGSAIGVVFSGDLISLFIYWEMMALGSAAVIFSSGHKMSLAAGLRYLYMHVFGGALLLAGIIGYEVIYDTFAVTSVLAHSEVTDSIVMGLMLAGILVNLAAPPFSAWLADAYPESSPFGAVFLSAFTTKTAIFVLMTLYAGTSLLIYIGCIMMVYGVIMAILENNIRRMLSYSIISQVGVMVACIGVGTEQVLYGVAIHAFCHIIYKALLFMSAGSILQVTGKTRFSELGGLARVMPVTTFCAVVGALTMAAVPLTAGFISKSLIASAVSDASEVKVWGLLVMVSAGTAWYALYHFCWFAFFAPAKSLVHAVDPPRTMQLAMLLLTGLCLLLGFPGVMADTLYRLLPGIVVDDVYTLTHVVHQLQLLLGVGVIFVLVLPWLKQRETITLDFDWFYRRLIPHIGVWVCNCLRPLGDICRRQFLNGSQYIELSIRHLYTHQAYATRGWSLGVTATLMIALLGLYLLFFAQ